MIRFLLLLTLLGAVICAGTLTGAAQGWFPLPSFLWPIMAVLFLFTIAIFYILHRRPPGLAFTQLYLFSIVTKFCLYGIFAALFIWRDRTGAASNAVFFLVAYMAFTALEVGLLFKKINR